MKKKITLELELTDEDLIAIRHSIEDAAHGNAMKPFSRPLPKIPADDGLLTAWAGTLIRKSIRAATFAARDYKDIHDLLRSSLESKAAARQRLADKGGKP
jgi:hypothetical protein